MEQQQGGGFCQRLVLTLELVAELLDLLALDAPFGPLGRTRLGIVGVLTTRTPGGDLFGKQSVTTAVCPQV
ncbi:MAG: hypothetical protein KAX46_08650 [Chromatiaceae bacterium]|nr:hypothetical protein [Chromatiaceae bacterium]